MTNNCEAIKTECIGKVDRVLGERDSCGETGRSFGQKSRRRQTAKVWDDCSVTGSLKFLSDGVPPAWSIRPPVEQHQGSSVTRAVVLKGDFKNGCANRIQWSCHRSERSFSSLDRRNGSAVNDVFASGDRGSTVRCKKRHQLGDFVRAIRPAERDAAK